MRISKEIKDLLLRNKYLAKNGVKRIIQKNDHLLLTGDIIPLYFSLDTLEIELYTTRVQKRQINSLTLKKLFTIEYIIRKRIKKEQLNVA